jgi:hypothetical protein
LFFHIHSFCRPAKLNWRCSFVSRVSFRLRAVVLAASRSSSIRKMPFLRLAWLKLLKTGIRVR